MFAMLSVVHLIIVTLAILATGWAKLSIFLLGDSVSIKLYEEGFTPIFDCHEVDPNITISVETSPTYNALKGRTCSGPIVERIGVSLHFGVFPSDYHNNWLNHQSYGSTNNSRTNIKIALSEFQNRTGTSNEPVLFIFLSGLWDTKRYIEHQDLYHGLDDFLRHFQNEYASMILELLAMLRPNDKLVIQTMHNVLDVPVYNDAPKKVARFLGIPLFDEASLLGTNMQEYLQDRTHPLWMSAVRAKYQCEGWRQQLCPE